MVAPMPKLARVILLSVLTGAASAARADDDPSTIVSALTVTAKPAPTPLPGVEATAPGKPKPTALEEVEVAPPKTCLPARNPPDRTVPAPRLVSTYPTKGQVVRPGLLVVRLTFDLPMACQGALGAGFFQLNPCADGRTQIWTVSYDRLNMRVLCRLKPKTSYGLWINQRSVEDFKGLGGRRPDAYQLNFDTSDEAPVATVADAVNADPRLKPAG
jgi:hypothetical protein